MAIMQMVVSGVLLGMNVIPFSCVQVGSFLVVM